MSLLCGTASDNRGTKGVDVGDGTEVSISSFDAEYPSRPLSLNVLIANGEHENTAIANSDFSGSYYTAGYEIWRSGEKAIIPFVRLSEYQTHETVKEIEETTLGLHYSTS